MPFNMLLLALRYRGSAVGVLDPLPEFLPVVSTLVAQFDTSQTPLREAIVDFVRLHAIEQKASLVFIHFNIRQLVGEGFVYDGTQLRIAVDGGPPAIAIESIRFVEDSGALYRINTHGSQHKHEKTTAGFHERFHLQQRPAMTSL